MLTSSLRETIGRIEVTSIDVTHGGLRLEKPLRTAGGDFDRREISVVRIESEDGVFGYGEAATLPDWGTETLEEARTCLNSLANHPPLLGRDLLEKAHGPTCHFALETALLDLVARQRGVSLRALLNPDHHVRRVPVNATIGGGPAKLVREQAAGLFQQGFDCIKVKVGMVTHDEDIARVRAAGASGARIRIDANGAWGVDEAISFLERLTAEVELEYCEQPVPADPPELLGQVASSVSVPIAADESAHPWPKPLDIIELRSADVLIIKPMVIGSILRCIDIWDRAVRQEMSVVFTSSIDGAIGRCAVAQMVASLEIPARGNSPLHHGLATGSLFERDIGELPIEAGRIVLPESPGLGIWPLMNAIERA